MLQAFTSMQAQIPARSPVLAIQNLTIHHPGQIQAAVWQASLTLQQGEIACLLGPSGCGKTTLLRAIAGFIPPTEGSIALGEQLASTPQACLAPNRRQVGLVFQDYALFPHLCIKDNIAFGLKHLPSPDRSHRATELLHLVGLEELANRYPHELSGGQQQRVALARALAPKPKLILLDEPFSNLDVELKERLSFEVRDILKAENMSAIMVTHDQIEAFALADHIGVMQQGKLQQWGTAYELYHQPQTRWVADFIGQGVFLPGHKTEHGIQIELGFLPMSRDQQPTMPAFDVLIRPDDVVHDDASPQTAKVLRKSFRGAEFLYTLQLQSGAEILAIVPSHHNHAVGEAIGIRLELDHIITFARH